MTFQTALTSIKNDMLPKGRIPFLFPGESEWVDRNMTTSPCLGIFVRPVVNIGPFLKSGHGSDDPGGHLENTLKRVLRT